MYSHWLPFSATRSSAAFRRCLHTPLMSATNAISGISLIGSLVLAGAKGYPLPAHILGFVAVTTATINVVGGFGITDRMLKMFRKREAKPKEATK